MKAEHTFDLATVAEALAKLDIHHELRGNRGGGGYRFISLRQIEPRGICYLETSPTSDNSPKECIVFCRDGIALDDSNALAIVAEPKVAFYKLMRELLPDRERPLGIHPTAVLGPDCDIDPGASIGPFCVLESCKVESGVHLHSHVVVMPGTVIEADVTVESHSTLGATGVAWAWDPQTRERVRQPQVGFTRIGKGSFLGSNVSVVRGSVNETTEVGQGCVIAHGSKIGHGSSIGRDSHFANNVSVAGNVTLGARCFVGSGAVIRPNTTLAYDVIVAAGAVVVADCRDSHTLLVGCPATAKPVKRSLSGIPSSLP